MPYISSKIKLNKKQDRRYKLTDEDKEEIKHLYFKHAISLRELGRQFKVDRHTIKAVVNPEWADRKRERCKEYMKTYTISKEQWAEYMRNHRRYKQELYLKGELKGEEDK